MNEPDAAPPAAPAARPPVATSPVLSGGPPGGPAPDAGPSAGAARRARSDDGAAQRLGGSAEYVRTLGGVAPLGHDEYHAVVRARMADLDRLDPGRERLVPGPDLVVALDVDGTILDMDGRVSERVMASIARMRAWGAQIVISTGRGIQAALPVARCIGLIDGWMVCANGALTVRMDPGAPDGYEIVDHAVFDPAPAIDALLAAVPDGIVAVEGPGAGFRATRPFPDGELIEDLTVVGLDELRAHPVSRVILRAPGMDVDEFRALVVGSGLHSVEYAIGWTAWLDVAPPGVTKASALARLAVRLGADAAHAVAVGDGSNDIEMISWAGAGAVMGSAPSSVVEAGDFVTESVWRDGAAAVMDAVIERVRFV